MAVLELHNLRVNYGRREAVCGIDLTVEPGEVLGLLGPNGAGKSTTLLAAAGVVKASGGSVRVDGHDPNAAKSKSAVGFADQPPSLYEFLTAREHLRFVAEARCGSSEAVEPLCEQLGLVAFADRLCRELSYGMRQRVGLAAALCGGPRLVLLDETLNGLDPDAGRRAATAIQAASADGVGVVLSTHLMDMAARLCHRVVVLNHGRLVAAKDGRLTATDLEELYLANVTPENAGGAA